MKCSRIEYMKMYNEAKKETLLEIRKPRKGKGFIFGNKY
jgi:hypothetical protein